MQLNAGKVLSTYYFTKDRRDLTAWSGRVLIYIPAAVTSALERQGGWLCDLAYESHHTVPLFLSKPYCRCHSPSSYALLVHFSISPDPAIGRQKGKSTLQTACFVP